MTLHHFTDDIPVRNKATYKDCVSESISSFDARDCNSKFGFSCDFKNGMLK